MTGEIGARLTVLEAEVQRAAELLGALREATARLMHEKAALEARLASLGGEVARLRERDVGRARLEGEHRRLLDERRQLLGQVEGILKDLARIDGL